MSNSATKKKKALSGATMGMRFMQRNVNAKTSPTKKLSPKHEKMINSNIYKNAGDDGGEDRDDYEDCEWEIKNGQQNGSDNSTSAMEVDGPNSKTSPLEQNMDIGSTKNDEQGDTNKNTFDANDDGDDDDDNNTQIPLYEIATRSDMYGICAEIIGRRSFNNFNKAVEETYQAAVYARRKSKLDKKVEKQHISDEELLNRYNQYVNKNGKDMIGKGEKKIADDVGNLKNKVLKKRKR